jgi:Fic family protein
LAHLIDVYPTMTQYIWQKPNWHAFSWDEKICLALISQARLKQGKLIQKVQALIDDDAQLAEAIVFEQEALTTAQIEGEKYNPKSVRSSVYRRLGLDYAGLPETDRHIDGLVEVLFDAVINFSQPLNKKRLFGWHAALFPTGYSGLSKIQVGKYRTDHEGPMQVVSGPIGKRKIHFQAPPAKKLLKEMTKFFNWWSESEGSMDGIIRAGIAHFYFVTLHPFEDGNGRLARALTDMALAQDDKLTRRYYSLSNEIVSQKKNYYSTLEQSQRGANDITNWLVWFINCFTSAIDNSETLLVNIFSKAEFWQKNQKINISSRQKKVMNKLLDVGKGQFQGGLTTRKYMSLTKVSRRTAVREMQDLVDKKLLTQNKSKGRNVSYEVKW